MTKIASSTSPKPHTRHKVVDDSSWNELRTTVSLALQRSWRRIKERHMDLYPTCDTGDSEPSWVSARRANLANCRFYQIPEELVLQILGNLDYVSMAMALRTCGLFLRLSFDRTLFSQRLQYYPHTSVEVWLRFGPPPSNVPPRSAT